VRRFILSLVFVSISISNSIGFMGGKTGSTACSFLKIGVGSRAIAMGETFTGIAEGINSIYWNPSGLALIDEREVSAMHIEWFQGIRYEYFAYAQPLEKMKGAIGASLNYLYMGGIEKRDDEGSSPQEAKAYDMALNLAYAIPYSNRLSLGINVKVIKSFIVDESAHAFACDIGGLYGINKNLKFGLSVQNLGTKMKFIDEADPLPLVVKIGTSYSFLYSTRLDKNLLLLALDINFPYDNNINTHFGTEYKISLFDNLEFGLRSGYKTNTDLGGLAGFCSGAGLLYKSVGIDYAFVPYGDLGNTHRISIRSKW